MMNRERGNMSNLVGAFEASADYFGNAVHAVFGLLDDCVHFGERGRFADCRILDCELQLLDVGRNLVDVIQQFFFQSSSWYLLFIQVF